MTENSKLAKAWGCSPFTISRWRNQGAPLADKAAMAQWLAARKNLPTGTRAILAKANGAAASAMVADAASDNVSIGAASALRRLEQAEKTTYRLLQTALKSGNPSGIKLARENWLSIGNQLRQYDRQVARDQRDAGELIPRRDIEAHVRHFMKCLRLAGQSAANSMAPRLIGCDAVDLSEAMKRSFWENMLSVFAVSASAKCPAQVPGWMIAVAQEDMAHTLRDVPEAVDMRRQMFESVFDEMVKANASQIGPQAATDNQQPGETTA